MNKSQLQEPVFKYTVDKKWSTICLLQEIDWYIHYTSGINGNYKCTGIRTGNVKCQLSEKSENSVVIYLCFLRGWSQSNFFPFAVVIRGVKPGSAVIGNPAIQISTVEKYKDQYLKEWERQELNKV